MFFVSAFLFFASSYLLLPTLPVILQQRGATPSEVGLVMGAFTAAAVLLRGPVGSLVDAVTPRRMLRVGLALTALGFLPYFLPGVFAMVPGRILQGLGLAAFSTASYLYLDSLGGPARRAELISLYGLSANVAMSIAPAFGSLLVEHGNEAALYVTGVVLALGSLSVVPVLRKHASVEPVSRESVSASEAGRRDWRVWRPALAMLGLAVAYGSIMVFVPIAIERQGAEDGWVFFSTYGAAIMTTRISLRRRINAGSRYPWIWGGCAAIVLALVWLIFARSLFMFAVAAVFFGAGVGLAHPTLMALCMEWVSQRARAHATAIATAAFDGGIAGGAAFSGWIAGLGGVRAAFVAVAILFVLGLLPLLQRAKRLYEGSPLPGDAPPK